MADFKNILALDTSVNGCGVAVMNADICTAVTRPMPRGHAEHLIPMIEEAMREVGLDYDALEALAVTTGPGAFTGIRIGLSAAQAFGISLSLPVFGISTLQALALDHAQKKQAGCLVAIDTKRGDFYVGRFDARAMEIEPPRLCTPEMLAEAAGQLSEEENLIGDGAEMLRGLSPHADFWFCVPDIKTVALCVQKKQSRDVFFKEKPAPVYLRGAAVSMPSAPPRHLPDAGRPGEQC
ncbi:MAG: tRNA (adenosine(37)-N6)-threonylcarbamoyltransferase complex dimerization subunit type 1 TsaB [Alphaproteobacteria bacterium]|nr:tRNA (adenosine(37)-N6)-threonylcarbamoyltransferase complex dimerization subunit type 1 TsaB [Alphaproteobacteria bacterium]